MSTYYDYTTDSWRLTVEGLGTTEVMDQVPDEDEFTLSVMVVTLPVTGGLLIELRGTTTVNLVAPVELLPYQLRVEFFDGIAHFGYSATETTAWIELAELPCEAPAQAGVVLMPTQPDEAVVSQFRLLPGRWSDEEVTFGVQTVVTAPEPPVAVTMSVEPVIHGLVGAQFGDLEYDAGRSVRWTQWFVDDMLITDVGRGDQRYWVVNWARVFPEVNSHVTGTNFWVIPKEFRKEQFRYAQTKMNMSDDDWVLWIDAHEGLICDTRSVPDDFSAIMFRSWIYREVARAVDASRDRIVLPFFAWVADNYLQVVTYPAGVGDPNVTTTVAVPYYLPYQGLTRLMKVSVLKDPQFNWSDLDRPVPVVDSSIKLAVVSYGYGHWCIQDIPAGKTFAPPLSADTDEGWKMRNLISKVRPLAGLPYGPEWVDPDEDTPGLPGQWCFAQRNAPVPINVPKPPPEAAPETAGLLTPLYHTVVRINLRDGMIYAAGETGNTHVEWNDTKKVWVERPALATAGELGKDEEPEPVSAGYGRGPYGSNPYGGSGMAPYGGGIYGEGPYGA